MVYNNSIYTQNFTNAYYPIMDHVLRHGVHLDSRAGATKEVLDFKTTILQPNQRCVGGASRGVNIFFLLAEALWIWAGRNDVGFLSIFNSRMAEFSDNGVTFNAPYGFRLRHYGHDSNQTFKAAEKDDDLRRYDSDKFHMDQIKWVLRHLNEDPNSRRAVVTIWNPEFDTQPCKDIPCNDMLMFKVRDRRLHLTIANRSNDLHWGLCTNVFQFSFIAELMAEILQLGLGNQTHNSQSLHIYDSNPLTLTMKENINSRPMNLYNFVDASPMGFDFNAYRYQVNLDSRIENVDAIVNKIIDLLQYASTESRTYPYFNDFWGLHKTPPYFTQILRILYIYVEYACHTPKNEEAKEWALKELCGNFKFSSNGGLCADYYLLAMNWFASRLPEDKVKQIVGGMSAMFPKFQIEWLGKL